jgi:hypothetical protein
MVCSPLFLPSLLYQKHTKPGQAALALPAKRILSFLPMLCISKEAPRLPTLRPSRVLQSLPDSRLFPTVPVVLPITIRAVETPVPTSAPILNLWAEGQHRFETAIFDHAFILD